MDLKLLALITVTVNALFELSEGLYTKIKYEESLAKDWTPLHLHMKQATNNQMRLRCYSTNYPIVCATIPMHAGTTKIINLRQRALIQLTEN